MVMPLPIVLVLLAILAGALIVGFLGAPGRVRLGSGGLVKVSSPARLA